jgi:hypothetical protein
MSKRKSPVPAIKLPSSISTPLNRGAAFDLLPNARAEFTGKEKLRVLAELYQLPDPLADHDAAIKLLLRVCFPSSRSGRPKGTTKKWGYSDKLRLIADVETIKRQTGYSDRKAIHHLLKRGDARVRGEASSKSAIDSLANRYYEALKSLPGSRNPKQRRVAVDWIARNFATNK